VITTTRVLDYFSTLVAEDDSLPLTEAALSLAQDAYPDLDLQGALAEIDELVVRLQRRMPADADIKQKVGILNRFFFRELGFGNNLNDFLDPDNSHLNVVLKRRRGIPISLAVLYLEMAEQIGVPVRGVAFPGHFLLRVTTPDGDVMLDPTTGRWSRCWSPMWRRPASRSAVLCACCCSRPPGARSLHACCAI
jgi:regulator of sirC expression with transglutaminase-like and TPR domain